ncbi:hypothetical protein [Mesobacillus zeae]|uniref:Uncharacterized protein n=1 Tax=Mesobacillus zeae TaxID=1917180 RepID=A0A398B329_9BACI|nr:hypothetical protein [Mesobacillus zeae]RID84202.1 hypothetical protein D1970_13880 [Mesobacillus zeae]
MNDWNEQGAPNNNLDQTTIRTSKLVGKEGLKGQGFTEELSDGGERDKAVQKQLKRRQPGM